MTKENSKVGVLPPAPDPNTPVQSPVPAPQASVGDDPQGSKLLTPLLGVGLGVAVMYLIKEAQGKDLRSENSGLKDQLRDMRSELSEIRMALRKSQRKRPSRTTFDEDRDQGVSGHTESLDNGLESSSNYFLL